mmetsp:Transcript_56616/g.127300  ORF Transcript_56616/g.127300 Transcript_56616/m.127300 type:complete len:90 (+) Transcript_56616:1845-2114(+)
MDTSEGRIPTADAHSIAASYNAYVSATVKNGEPISWRATCGKTDETIGSTKDKRDGHAASGSVLLGAIPFDDSNCVPLTWGTRCRLVGH